MITHLNIMTFTQPSDKTDEIRFSVLRILRRYLETVIDLIPEPHLDQTKANSLHASQLEMYSTRIYEGVVVSLCLRAAPMCAVCSAREVANRQNIMFIPVVPCSVSKAAKEFNMHQATPILGLFQGLSHWTTNQASFQLSAKF